MPSGGGGGGSTGPSVYKKRLPEEQQAFDVSTGLIDEILKNMGISAGGLGVPQAPAQAGQAGGGVTANGNRIAEIQARLDEIYNMDKTTGDVRKERKALEKELKQLQESSASGGSTLSMAEIQARLEEINSMDKTTGDIRKERKALTKELKQRQQEGDVPSDGNLLYKPTSAISPNATMGDIGNLFAPTGDQATTTPTSGGTQPGFESQLQDYSQNALLQGLNGQIPDVVRQQIDTIYNEQDRVGRERLMQLATEAAGGRGLNLSDTPIGQPLLREYGNLQSQLGAAKAGSLLQGRSDEIARAQALREYQNSLNQLRDIQNPSQLLGQVSNLGLGLYTPRFRVGSAGSATPAGSTLGGVASVLGGLGSLASIPTGSGTLGGAAVSGIGSLIGGIGGLFGSSIDYKNIYEEVTPETIAAYVEQIENLPIYRWNYKPGIADEAEHIGPVVEEMPQALVKGKTLDVISILGVLMGAVKHLSLRIKELESNAVSVS